MAKPHIFEIIAGKVTKAAGSTPAFSVACAIILGWAALGPVFGFSDTWQLVINTSTTIVTFLMVFLIQRSQNKDSRAIHLKLNELIASHRGASNNLVNVEDLSESEIDALHEHFCKLAEMTKREKSVFKSHSVEEAEERHKGKGKHA